MTPAENFKKKVYGMIICENPAGRSEYEVIDENEKCYITNQWHKPGVVQFVPKVFVIEFIGMEELNIMKKDW